MANVSYSGAATSPLMPSSAGTICEPREPQSMPGPLGVTLPPGYDLMTYQRLASVLYPHPPTSSHVEQATGASAPPTPPGHPAIIAGQEQLLHSGNLELKDGIGGIGSSWPYPVLYPYDTYPPYPFTHGYGMTFDAARRKNATRETTATLKAWLNEHKKNPYPTKGEKIMLAIITKMTLTQVSTWFANARRRLKKENTITWEPRNKTDEDDDDDDLKDDLPPHDSDRSKDLDSAEQRLGNDESIESGDEHLERSSSSPRGMIHCQSNGHSVSPPVKPRIWSLADMAASSSTSSSSASLSHCPSIISASKFLHRPLHLDTSPYGRPLATINPRLSSPQEALLQVYAKSLGLPTPATATPFPSIALNGFGSPIVSPQPLPSEYLSHPGFSSNSLIPSTFPPQLNTSSAPFSINRPIVLRPTLPNSPVPISMNQILPGGAKLTFSRRSATPTSPSTSSPRLDEQE